MKFLKHSLTAAALLSVSMSAQSQILWDTLVYNELNFYEDQNRESVFDIDNSGSVTNGDVFFGYVRIDDRSAPLPGASVNGELYGVFSQTIDGMTTTDNGDGTTSYTFNIIPTTTVGLRLSDHGVANTDASSLVALYEDVDSNLITTSPGDVDLDGRLSIFDFVDEITSFDQDLVAGLEEGVDHWVASADVSNLADPIANLALTETLTLIGGIPLGGSVSFHAGLGITYTKLGLEDCPNPVETLCWGRLVPDSVDSFPPSLHELTVQNGGLTGASDLTFGPGALEGNPLFSNNNANVDGRGQLLGYDFYGFSSNADFGLAPQVPEPSMIALMGLGLLGMGASIVRRRKSA